MAEKQIKKEKNQPLLYTQHLDLYKLQRHMQRSVIVKQTEQTAETEGNEIDNVENSEQTHHIVEEINVADQETMQTDVEEIDVIDQETMQTDVEEIDVIDQETMQTDVEEIDVIDQETMQTDVEEIDVIDQETMQTDVEEIDVIDQETMQTDVAEDVVDQHNTHANAAEENQPKQNDKQFVKSSSITWQNKSFKAMNNEEKVYFLLHRPHYIPNVKCIVKTERASYIGVITSYENRVLQMVVPGNIGNFSLNIEDVVSIRMTGL
ncbi:CotO family spore coat protein [Bacillus sp. S13(2024)]|uniref:CotO family spore coat protein n=1 Tax=unclassified Bacillus (in: firmicutes) TaxID=185979 RepID=UPI003D1B026D